MFVSWSSHCLFHAQGPIVFVNTWERANDSCVCSSIKRINTSFDHLLRWNRWSRSSSFCPARSNPRVDRLHSPGLDGWIGQSRRSGGDRSDQLLVPIPLIEQTFRVDISDILPKDNRPRSNSKALLSIKQRALPLVPAYCITTHKSQGQTLSKVGHSLDWKEGLYKKNKVCSFVRLWQGQRNTADFLTKLMGFRNP